MRLRWLRVGVMRLRKWKQQSGRLCFVDKTSVGGLIGWLPLIRECTSRRGSLLRGPRCRSKHFRLHRDRGGGRGRGRGRHSSW